MCNPNINDRNNNNSDQQQTTENSIWSNQIQCGLGLSTGQCIHGECICTDGYRHDMTFIRYRNCSLPNQLYPTLFALNMVCSFILIPYIIIKIRQSKNLAKLELVSLLISSILQVIAMITFISFDFVFNSYGFFILYILISSLAICDTIAIYSLIFSLSIALRTSAKSMMRVLMVSIIFFRIIGIIPVIIAAAFYDDPNDRTKDRMWGNLASIFSFLVGIEIGCLAAVFVSYGTKMINLIESAKQLDPTRQNKKLSEIYLKKVKELTKGHRNLPPITTTILCVIAIIQFTTGAIPFNFIFIGLMQLNIPILIFMAVRYAARTNRMIDENQSKISKPNKEETPKLDDNNRYNSINSIQNKPADELALNIEMSEIAKPLQLRV